MNDEIKEILNYLKSSFRNYAVSHSDYLNWIKIIEEEHKKLESDNLILAMENNRLTEENVRLKEDLEGKRCN